MELGAATKSSTVSVAATGTTVSPETDVTLSGPLGLGLETAVGDHSRENSGVPR